MSNTFQNIMNFINDNTILLICICGFLILVLIGYLIDSSIKARKLEKSLNEQNQKNNENINGNMVIDYKEEQKEEPSIKQEKLPEVEKVDSIISNEYPEETIELSRELKNSFDVTPKEENVIETPNVVKEETFEEKNDINKENEPVSFVPSFEQAEKSEDKGLNEILNIENNTSNTSNNKKLSDILGNLNKNKVEDNINEENELDRIMKKLDSNSKDKNLEETTDFNNMF